MNGAPSCPATKWHIFCICVAGTKSLISGITLNGGYSCAMASGNMSYPTGRAQICQSTAGAFPLDICRVEVIIASFNFEKLILMSQSGYRVVCSNKDFSILGVLGDSGFSGE